MDEWVSRCDSIYAGAERRLREATTAQDVEAVRIQYLGRKGTVAHLLAQMPSLDADDRRALGQAANELKRKLSELVEQALVRAGREAPKAVLAADATLPPLRPPHGHVHPISRTIEEIVDIFRTLGFESVEGPEVELDWYNFEALNIPADHPARDDWDTFYITDEVLLRPHTSPGQIRVMEKRKPPLRIVVPGRCFRRDTEDATHFSMFHQVEGLMVDEGVSFGDLKAVLHIFLREFFRQDVKVRFVPDFFPFTEPSAQVHCTCAVCQGEGCRTCSYSGWVELLGCGMVNPKVFEAVRYDTERYTGFAFGMGADRLAMLKHQIADGRLFVQGDVRFLSQF
jgi:phenylalanyl-tRNA synthetase alpha chain